MNVKKCLAVLTAFALVLSSVPAAVLASDDSGQTSSSGDVYKASDAWSTSKNGNDYWSWEYKDYTDGSFKKLGTYFSSGVEKFGTDPTAITGTPTGTDYKSGDGFANSGNYDWYLPVVGKYWMRPMVKAANLTQTQKESHAVSRTFTSPKTGTVTLTTENGYIYAAATAPDGANEPAYIKITRNGVQVWPKSGKLKIPYDKQYIQSYKFDPVTITVCKGDVLRFEVYSGYNGAAYCKQTYWAPVVTYDAESTVDTFSAEDAWPSDANLTAASLKNDDPVWQFAYQNDSTGGAYKAYAAAYSTGTDSNSTGYAKPVEGNYLTTGNNNVVYSDSSSNPGMRNAMGKYWMRVSVAGSTAPKNSTANRIAKIFTAPKSGNISISAKDIAGDSKIYNKRTNANNPGALLRVKKLSADGTATELWKYEFKNTSSDLLLSADCGNTSTFINKGEQLIFEVSAENDASGWHKQVFWNPTVTYYDTQDTAARIYKATDAWSTDANNKYNGHNEWKWEQYDAAGAKAYTEVNSLISNKPTFGKIPYKTETYSNVGYSWEQNSSTTRFAGVGENWMATRIQGSPDATTKNHAVARTFTVPYDGTVVLSALDVDEKGIAYAYGGATTPSGNTTPAYLKITKTNSSGTEEVIWPKNGAEYKISATTSNIQDAPISPAAVKVSKGEKIRFVAYNGDGKSGDAGTVSSKRVYWRPTVEYLTLPDENDIDPIYAAANGKANATGRKNDPLTFAKAIEEVKDGGTVYLDGSIKLDADFVWPDTGSKKFTLCGVNNAKIDFTAAKDSKSGQTDWLNIYSDVTMKNLELVGDKDSQVAANGHNVVIEDSVTTSAVFAFLYGGSSRASVSSANLKVYGGNYGIIYGGSTSNAGAAVSVNGDCVLTVGGKVNSDIDTSKWDDKNQRKANIFGGGYGGSVKGKCELNLEGDAKAKFVWGGQFGDHASENEGKVTVNVKGGNYMNVFAIYKNTKNVSNSAVDVSGTKAEINMTGGTVEALIGSQASITGDIVINANGGTVTRRIIGGTYNDGSDNFVTGTVTTIIGKELKGFTDKQWGNGINGGSRTTKNHSEETATVIFLDGTYDTLQDHIAKANVTVDFGADFYASTHDYIVAATANGTVAPGSAAGKVTVTPSEGYSALLNGASISSGEYELKSGVNNIVFSNGSSAIITGAELSGKTVTVTYTGIDAGKKVIAALYDKDGNLFEAAYADTTSDGSTKVSFANSVDTDQGYELVVMIWSDFDNITPLCKRY